jgi:hypothetical protein
MRLSDGLLLVFFVSWPALLTAGLLAAAAGATVLASCLMAYCGGSGFGYIQIVRFVITYGWWWR